LPKERTRADLHKLPNYYPLRNHLIEFLVTRSRDLALAPEPSTEARRNPPIVRPTATFNPHASTSNLSQPPAQAAPNLSASGRVSAA
jgi:nitrate/nitrite transport system ATP-binding protein